jgi:carbon monoxide dehydrogenase subunit G
MKLENSFTVPVPVDQAWQVLQDVERIAPCMPGATLDSVDGDSFAGRVKVKVGPIMLTYSGKATFQDKDEATHSMTIDASGKETRGSGTAKATVKASMQADGDSTKVLLTTELAVTGKPAQFGRGVMADVSGKLIDQFAACLASEVESGESGETPPEQAASAAPAPAATESAATVSSIGATPATPAAPPLPPSGAPQQAAPAPAMPLPATGLSSVGTSGAAGVAAANGSASTPSATPKPRPRPQQAEAIDLLGTAGMPVAKRLAPVVAGVVAVIVLIRVLRNR